MIRTETLGSEFSLKVTGKQALRSSGPPNLPHKKGQEPQAHILTIWPVVLSLHPRGHWVMSGDTWGCHDLGWGWMLHSCNARAGTEGLAQRRKYQGWNFHIPSAGGLGRSLVRNYIPHATTKTRHSQINLLRLPSKTWYSFISPFFLLLHPV